MYFIGVDLAWGWVNQSGLVVLDSEGRCVDVSVGHDDASIHRFVEPYVGGDVLVAFDAPLIVNNPTGLRPCEAALNRDFRRFHAGAHPTNTGKPEFAGTPRAAQLAGAWGLDMDPHSTSARRAIEVYPHPASVVLFGLDQTIKYKHKTGRSFELLKSELLRLIRLLEGLADAEIALVLSEHPGWTSLRREVQRATRKHQLRRTEDRIDAVLCAYIALYAHRRPAGIITYGDFASGYIVTPALPRGRATAALP